MGDIICRHMGANMMDRDQRQVMGIGIALGKIQPHQQRTDQAGGGSYRHRIQILLGQSALADTFRR